MATLELQCGPEPGSCVWGGERAELIDSFDSEMQEWEDQLQEIQRKIEELYNEVKARRESSESNSNNASTNKSLDITLLPVNSDYGLHKTSVHPDNSLPVGWHKEVRDQDSVTQFFGFHNPGDYSNGSNNYTKSSGCNYHTSCHDLERQGATLDILNGYLHPQLENNLKNSGHVNSMHKSYPVTQTGQDSMKTSEIQNRSVLVEEFEEVENKKNKKANLVDLQGRHISWKEPISNNPVPKNSACRQMNKPRDAPPVPLRSVHLEPFQQTDRKCLFIDRKCGSPSVLRKFVAMLQENEGKTLIEDGLVTTVVSGEQPKHTSTPSCQSKFEARRASTHGPVKKCLEYCDEQVVKLEHGQEHCVVGPSRHHFNGARGKPSTPGQSVLAKNSSHLQSTPKSECHKKALGQKVQNTGSQDKDLYNDFQMVERILGTGSQHSIQVHAGHSGTRNGFDNLDQLLEMMELENSRSQISCFAQRVDIKKVICEANPTPSSSTFSRPARPAKQRRPSRWANQDPASKANPTFSTPSPNLKPKRFLNSYSQQTESTIKSPS